MASKIIWPKKVLVYSVKTMQPVRIFTCSYQKTNNVLSSDLIAEETNLKNRDR